MGVGVVLAPICLTAGTALSVAMYIHLLQSGGADALLEKTGTKDSKFLAKAQDFAANYGAFGLVFIQVNPLTPIPTAVLVVAGMVAKMNPITIFCAFIISKFCMLLLNSIVVSYVSEGKTVEQCLREQLKGEAVETKTETEEKKKE